MLPPIGVPGCIDMENPSFAHNLLCAPWQRGSCSGTGFTWSEKAAGGLTGTGMGRICEND